jgi:hypothetical protein
VEVGQQASKFVRRVDTAAQGFGKKQLGLAHGPTGRSTPGAPGQSLLHLPKVRF